MIDSAEISGIPGNIGERLFVSQLEFNLKDHTQAHLCIIIKLPLQATKLKLCTFILTRIKTLLSLKIQQSGENSTSKFFSDTLCMKTKGFHTRKLLNV